MINRFVKGLPYLLYSISMLRYQRENFFFLIFFILFELRFHLSIKVLFFYLLNLKKCMLQNGRIALIILMVRYPISYHIIYYILTNQYFLSPYYNNIKIL